MMSKFIELTRNKVSIIDEEDFIKVSQYKWHTCMTGSRMYAQTRIDGKRIYMHHFILPKKDYVEIDHVNCNGLDNRKENLRYATSQQNKRNREKGKNNTSGFKGVSFRKDRNKWRAHITIDYKYRHLGHYDTAIEAAVAYNQAALKFFGEYANLNVIEDKSDVQR